MTQVSILHSHTPDDNLWLLICLRLLFQIHRPRLSVLLSLFLKEDLDPPVGVPAPAATFANATVARRVSGMEAAVAVAVAFTSALAPGAPLDGAAPLAAVVVVLPVSGLVAPEIASALDAAAAAEVTETRMTETRMIVRLRLPSRTAKLSVLRRPRPSPAPQNASTLWAVILRARPRQPTGLLVRRHRASKSTLRISGSYLTTTQSTPIGLHSRRVSRVSIKRTTAARVRA